MSRSSVPSATRTVCLESDAASPQSLDNGTASTQAIRSQRSSLRLPTSLSSKTFMQTMPAQEQRRPPSAGMSRTLPLLRAPGAEPFPLRAAGVTTLSGSGQSSPVSRQRSVVPDAADRRNADSSGRHKALLQRFRSEPCLERLRKQDAGAEAEKRTLRRDARRPPSFGMPASLSSPALLNDTVGSPCSSRHTSGPQSRPGTPLSPLSPQHKRANALQVLDGSDAFRDLKSLRAPSQLLARRKKDESRPKNSMTVTTAGVQQHSRKQPLHPQKQIRMLGLDEKIFDLYYWDEVLQEEGDGGKVVICQPKMMPGTSCGSNTDASSYGGSPTSPKSVASGRSVWDGNFDYVMKIRAKASIDEVDKFRSLQTRMLNFPPHIGVMPLLEVLEDERFLYIVMQRATGGSFFCGLLTEFKDGVMPPRAVKGLIQEILEAVSHVHNQGMLHRDIKPDNLVMQVRDDPLSPIGTSKSVVLIDFDHADPEWSSSTAPCMDEYLGTMRFNAPETFLGDFSQASDLYSVGCILFLLMSGRMPYRDSVFGSDEAGGMTPSLPQPGTGWRAAVYERMKDAPVQFNDEPWHQQPLCRAFCESLVTLDPKERLASAEEALLHEWFSEAD